MTVGRSVTLAATAVLLLGVGGTALPARQGAQAAQPAATLSRPEMEAFLKNARIVKTRSVSKGVTGTLRATLSDGTTTHDASIQTIDQSLREFRTQRETEINFRDTWRFNVAAYLLDKLLDLNMIPATVERRYKASNASFTWWVDDVMMDEGERLKRGLHPEDRMSWNEQMWTVQVFDQLIYNTDRNLGNLLITSEWRIWMIDHSRAFRWHETLRDGAKLLRCERRLLDRLRALDEPTLKQAMGAYLGKPEIEGLLARRDAIVAIFEKKGEQALYDARRAP